METCSSNVDRKVCVEGVVYLGFLLVKSSFCLTAIYAIYAAEMPVHFLCGLFLFNKGLRKLPR